MTVRLTQVGTKLILENKEALVQFSRNTPVRVKLSDSVFASNTDIVNPSYTYCLNWQDRYKEQIVQTPLTHDSTTDVCTGKIGLAATQIYGLSYVSLSATDAAKEITLTTSAAEIYIPRSVDPELAQVNTPETVGGLVEDAVTKYLTEHPATTGATEKEAAQIAANTAALNTKLSTDGYNTGDLAKIPVVGKDGNLTVRRVNLLDDDDADGNRALVLRGAVGQILASITQAELKDLLGVSGSGATVLDMYPVGSIYQTASSTFNPQTAWGGTWERIKDRFLLAAGTAYAGGSTGGEATHKLTAQEMPSHTHTMYVNNDGSSSSWSPTAGEYLIKPDGVTTSKKNYQAKLAQNGAGLDQAHNNMPPYLAVYIWKRTA